MLQVRLLGDMRADLDGRAIAPPASRRAWALLAWLALHPGEHDRATLAARFWPDVLDASARASLRSAIWALRRALGPGAETHLLATHERIALKPQFVDALAFEALMAEGRPAEALALGEGELLTGLQEDWAVRARDAHRERVLEAHEALARAAESAGDLAEAVRRTRAQVALDPLGEEPHRRLIRRLAQAGDRPAALAVYARFAERLRRELAIAPSGATRRLAEGIREPLPGEPLAASRPPPVGRGRGGGGRGRPAGRCPASRLPRPARRSSAASASSARCSRAGTAHAPATGPWWRCAASPGSARRGSPPSCSSERARRAP